MIAPAQPTANATSTAARRWVIPVIVLLAATYLFGVTPRWWPTPDSAIYLGLGRSIAEGDGYRFNGQVHTTFAPGLPLILAGVHRICGEGFLAPNLVIAACGLATLLLIFRTLSLLGASRSAALAVTLATGFSYTFYLNAHRILSDMPFALAFWAVMYCALRARRGGPGWLAAVALLAVAGIVVRAPGVLLMAPLGLGFLLAAIRPSRRLHAPRPDGPETARPTAWVGGVILLSTLLAAGGLYALARLASPATPGYLTQGALPSGAGPEHYLLRLLRALWAAPEALAELLTSQEALWPVALIILALAAAGMVRLGSGIRRMLLPALGLYPLALALCYGQYGLTPRYLLPLGPLLMFPALAGADWAAERVMAWRRMPDRRQAGPWAMAILAGVVLAANAPRVAREAFYYSILSWSPDYFERRGDWQHADLFRALELIERECPPRAAGAVESGWARTVHFLTRRPVVPVPEGPGGTWLRAEALAGFAADHRELAFLVLVARKGPDDRDRLAAALAEEGWISRYDGSHVTLYLRRPP